MEWQRVHILATVNYLHDRIHAGARDARTRAIYEGLLDVLDPSRREGRLQKELARAVHPKPAKVERRLGTDRRSGQDRRKRNIGNPEGDQRKPFDRRSIYDRRSRDE
jgi:hypothetical protein